MKNHLNIIINTLFIFTLVFSLAFSSLANPIQKAEAATSTTCTSPEGYDSKLNLPCSVLQIPCPASGVYSNGEKCRAVVSGNTNVDTLTLSSNARAKKGTVSSATKTIQTILKALGFDPGGVDGKFGKNTENAVKAYQRSRGLFADGKVGAKTVAELQKAIQLLKKFSTGGAGGGTGKPYTDFTDGLDLNQESEWGEAISFDSEGRGIIYKRNFGLDPKNGLPNTMITYVERPGL